MKGNIGFIVLTVTLISLTSALAGVHTALRADTNPPIIPLSSEIKKSAGYDFIIISPSDLSPDLQPLVLHKKSHGLETKIVTLEEIYDSTYFPVEGRDNPEKIKYFIKNAIENWGTGYLMLVGGEHQMPVRYVETTFGRHYHVFICDLYYADIYDTHGTFCNWDSNNNNIFGEVTDEGIIDEVDLLPDIRLGRLLCHTASEVQVVVQKIIQYEETTYNTEWFKNIILFGGDSQPSFLEFLYPLFAGKLGGIVFEGEYMGNKISRLLTDFQATKIYSSGFYRPGIQMLTNTNVNKAINKGAGFVLFAGHGNPDKIWNYLPFSVQWDYRLPRPQGYTINETRNLTNGDKLPVILFSACSCGDFNYTSSPLAWEFIKLEQGGAIACLANTNPSYLIPSTLCTDTVNGHLTMTFYEAYMDGIDILGDLWHKTILDYMTDEHAWELTPINWKIYNVSVMTLEVWTLFGDPTLKIGGYP